MRRLSLWIVAVVLLLGGAAQAQMFDITNPGDPLVGVPDDNNWPAAEFPLHAIDDVIAGAKYLCFETSFVDIDGNPDPTNGGAGFRVTPSGPRVVVKALNFASANDAPERDPVAFRFSGSNESIDGPYELIAEGTIDEFDQATAYPRNTWITTPIPIKNRRAFKHYEVFFTDIRDRAPANSMQIGEVELLSDGSLAGAAGAPVPEDEATDVARDVVLSWTPGEMAATHDVYFGTVFDDVNNASRSNPMDVLVSQGQTAVSFDPEGLLEFGQTYYWRVDEVNSAPDFTIFKSDVWSFTVEPFAYPIEGIAATTNAISDPGSGIEKTIDGSGLDVNGLHSTASTDMWLGSPSDGPIVIEYEFDHVYKLHELLVWNYNVEFEVILGFGVKDVTVEYSADGAEWSVLGDVVFNQAPSRAGYAANTTVEFGGVPAKYVRLTVNSGWGMLGQYGLSEVQFTYIPAQAREPQPANGATDVAVDSALSWRAGREAVSHEVYFGTDPDALASVDSTSATSYTPADLTLGTTYYWKVDEVNEADAVSVWEGDVWSFTAQEYIVVDDFESYNDDIEAGTTIFDTWVDGWVNDNGSTVGYFDAPFAEQTIVRSGKQAMPLFYDNASFSFAEAEYSTTQDWTTNGIRSLSLYFYGDPDNDGQFYVRINNARINYDGDPADIKRPAWQVWNIDLTTVGTNLSNVSQLAIGIDGAGASGILYIDDIRLYPGAPEFITPVEPDAAGLVAHYSFDGNANDSSGNGYHGTLNGGATYVAGLQGSALDCDGVDGYVSTGKSASDLGIGGNSPRTVTVWVFTRGFANGGIYDVGARTTGQDFCLRTLDSIENRWRIQYWGGDFDFTYDTADRWVHFAHVHDGTHTKIYADGVLIVDWEKTIDTTDTNSWQIGLYGWPDSYFDGIIDELSLYNRALSPEEILGAAGRTEPVAKPF